MDNLTNMDLAVIRCALATERGMTKSAAMIKTIEMVEEKVRAECARREPKEN